MKTISLLVLITLSFTTSLIAQNGNNGVEHRSTVASFEGYGSMEVICNGTQIDLLSGDGFTMRYVEHGGFLWYKLFANNATFTSEWTGEVFKIQEVDTHTEDGLIYWHYNAIGNMGSHYIGQMVSAWTGDGFELIEFRTVCPGN